MPLSLCNRPLHVHVRSNVFELCMTLCHSFFATGNVKGLKADADMHGDSMQIVDFCVQVKSANKIAPDAIFPKLL